VNLIAANPFGLCNRLKGLVTVARVSGEFRIYWERIPKVLNCDIGELFEIDTFILERKPFPNGSKLYRSWRLGVLASDGIPEGFCSFGASVQGVGLMHNDPLGRNIDQEYHRIPEKIIDIYVKLFLKIKPRRDLNTIINSFSEKFDENTVSMNIRSWNDDPQRNKEFFDFNAYVVEMKKFPTEVKFFVTSDSFEVIKDLSEIFPERILSYPRITALDTSRDSALGMQEDVIELYLVSKNKTIIGSFLSTYTEVAWWIGGAKAKVILPLPNNNTKVYDDNCKAG